MVRLAILLALVVIAGCSTSENNCQTTCPGCCTDTGQCMPGINPDHCGLNGVLCTQCGPGVSCTDGACKSPGGTCGCPQSQGCCDTSNTCQPGTTNQLCGVGAEACKACTGGTVCTGGSCAPPSCQCEGGVGCCNVAVCEPGDTHTACGNGGVPCMNCSVLGKICDKTKRECVTTAGCSECPPNSCCNGVACEPGDQDEACGTGRAPCTNCTAIGQRCDAVDRVCKSCPNCTTGCCLGMQCAAGDTDEACGSDGDSCVNCKVLRKKCKLKDGTFQCVPWCGDCPSGCCLGPSCVLGTADTACGANNEQCEDCSTYNGTCLPGSRVCTGLGCPNCLTGCCDGNKCKPGNDASACGTDGRRCINCGLAANGWQCNPPDYFCGPPGPQD